MEQVFKHPQAQARKIVTETQVRSQNAAFSSNLELAE
jgi:hypothetical protein